MKKVFAVGIIIILTIFFWNGNSKRIRPVWSYDERRKYNSAGRW